MINRNRFIDDFNLELDNKNLKIIVFMFKKIEENEKNNWKDR